MKKGLKSSIKKIAKVVDGKKSPKGVDTKFWRNIALLLLFLLVFNQLFLVNIEPRYTSLWSLLDRRNFQEEESETSNNINNIELQDEVIPTDGIELPIKWGDVGQQMVADGVIDQQLFREIYTNGLKEEEEEILSGTWDGVIILNQQNSHFLLNMLWAFGLANKNDILETGEMTDEQYGGDAGQFASTGGWTLAKGDSMSHYSAHPYVSLTNEQQALVDRVSAGIYRPCCGNSTHFPDCNHGMAMLGLLELMAANGVSEQEMYDVALKVNSYWFPQTYIDLATYFKEQGQEWDEVDSKLVLSAEYSSGQGYQATRQNIKSLPTQAQGGGGCGV